MPTGGDLDVRVGDPRIILEYAAGTCDCEARLEVPKGVPVEVGACGCMLVETIGIQDDEKMYRRASVAAMGVSASSISSRLC